MEKRSYKKFLEVYSDLEKFCDELSQKGVSQFPHERELAAALQTSRMTLRKALVIAIKRGLLVRSGRFVKLSRRRVDISNLGRVLFISSGVGDEFYLYSFKQLYQRLKPALKSMNLELELLLTNQDSCEDDILARCMECDIILLTVAMCRPGKSSLFRIFQQAAAKRKLIALSDPWYEKFQNFIALDNDAVGILAARTLLDAGCRKVCCLYSDHNSLIFKKRESSFCDIIRRSGAELVVMPDSSVASSREIVSRQFQHACESGCDGVFLLSDEVINVVMEKYFVPGIIPDKIKLITVNGCGRALHYEPQVSCISHGIPEVASALAAYLVRLSSHPEWQNFRKLVTPRIFPGKTI